MFSRAWQLECREPGWTVVDAFYLPAIASHNQTIAEAKLNSHLNRFL